jgi:hypothetical protein
MPARDAGTITIDVRLEIATPNRNRRRQPARAARMLALAHHLEAALDRGQLHSRAHAARCLGMTRARLTQIFDLLLLAPDIQEELLFLEAVDGIEPLAERDLRPIVKQRLWADQRAAWRELRDRCRS